MVSAIRPFQLAQVEAQIVRLARAYSPDRGIPIDHTIPYCTPVYSINPYRDVI